MYFSKENLISLEKIKRLNLINSVTGIKPANLIGTTDINENTNLAIFSSVIHLGSNPALLGFICRPTGDETRDTYNNIKSTNYYTINHIHQEFIEKAHFTSAKFEPWISEFEKCSLTPEYLDDFKAPYVKESNLKIGLKLVEEIPIKINNTILIIGEIEHLYLPDNVINDVGQINLEVNGSIGISGLNSYYRLLYKESHPYARVNDVPNFK